MYIAKLKPGKRLCVPTITLHKQLRNKVILNIELETIKEFEAIQDWCFKLGHEWYDIGQNLRGERCNSNFPYIFTFDAQNPHLYVSSIDNNHIISVDKIFPKIYKGQDTPSQRGDFYYVYRDKYSDTTIQELRFKDYFDIIEI